MRDGQERSMFHRAIVRPPGSTFPDGLTTMELGRPDLARAREQHRAYGAALEECGLTLIPLPEDDRYPDSTFVEDTAILLQAIAGHDPLDDASASVPIPDYVAGLRELQATVRGARVKTLVSFVLRWNPLFETIRALLADAVVGRLFYAEVDYLHGIGPWYGQYSWNVKKEIGGSSLLTAGCHAVDGLRWFVGKRAVEVFAYSNFSPQNPLRYEYEPNSVTLVKFEDGTIGKVASSIECVMPYVFNIVLLGDQGTIRNNQVFSKRWVGQRGWATIPTILPDSGDVTHHPFRDEVNHFVDCILNDRESHASLEDAAETHEICFASEISAREKGPVSVPLGKR